jgi:hypothetical protein
VNRSDIEKRLPDTARILNHAINNAVVQLPYRRYPGVLFQGDTLYTIYRLIKDNHNKEAAARLKTALDNYELALREAGFTHPPYVKQGEDDDTTGKGGGEAKAKSRAPKPAP